MTDRQNGLLLAERIRSSIEAMQVELPDTSFSVTVSIGVASAVPGRDLTADQLLGGADRALYRAKGDSRNVVRNGGPL